LASHAMPIRLIQLFSANHFSALCEFQLSLTNVSITPNTGFSLFEQLSDVCVPAFFSPHQSGFTPSIFHAYVRAM
jgi:hypothetical protein